MDIVKILTLQTNQRAKLKFVCFFPNVDSNVVGVFSLLQWAYKKTVNMVITHFFQLFETASEIHSLCVII